MPGGDYKKRDPLFGAAILRVSLEMKGVELGRFSGIVEDVIRRLGITEEALETYIREHRAFLEETCRKEGLV